MKWRSAVALLCAGCLAFPVLWDCAPKTGCPTGYGCVPRSVARKARRAFHGGWSDYGNSYTSARRARRASGLRYARRVRGGHRYSANRYRRRMNGMMLAQRSYRRSYRRAPFSSPSQVRVRRSQYRGTPFASRSHRRPRTQYKGRTAEMFRKKEKRSLHLRH